MTEFEKMIAGQMYDAQDGDLVDRRYRARELLDQINANSQVVLDEEARQRACRLLFGSVGDGLILQPPFYCDYGTNISMGNNVFINFNCVFLDVARISVGDAVLIAPNVQIYTAAHPLDWRERRAGKEYGRPVAIGSDVWIGGGTVICPGVSIGDKSVIGAGAVVTKDVPAGVVAAGNPARVIRNL